MKLLRVTIDVTVPDDMLPNDVAAVFHAGAAAAPIVGAYIDITAMRIEGAAADG